MTVYALAQLTITDRARYDRYRDGFMETLQPFGGWLLAGDEAPELIEGEWSRDKVVLIAFESRERFQAWAASPEYLRIALDRKAGAEGPVLLVQGI